jgi:hypothetical protein
MGSKACRELVLADSGILDDVMQHACGDDLIRIVAAAQQMRDLEGMQDERCAIA